MSLLGKRRLSPACIQDFAVFVLATGGTHCRPRLASLCSGVNAEIHVNGGKRQAFRSIPQPQIAGSLFDQRRGASDFPDKALNLAHQVIQLLFEIFQHFQMLS